MLDIIIENGSITNMFELTLEREKKNYSGIFGITNIKYRMLEKKKNELLNDDELEHFESLTNRRTKEAYLRSRFIGKMSVGKYIRSGNIKDIKIRHGVFNQPLLDGTNGISISHSGDFAACVVFPDEHPMGVDLEVIQKDAVKKISSQLTRKEIILAANLWEEEKYSFTRCWTAKEALSKVLKTGLMIPFQILEISSMESEGTYHLSYFENFVQYKAISCTIENVMISLVLPAETNFNIEKII